MTLHDFIGLPWQNIAGFVGFLIALTILFSKWIPGVKQIVEAIVSWLGQLFTQELAAKIDEKFDRVLAKMDDHINDPDAHGGKP